MKEKSIFPWYYHILALLIGAIAFIPVFDYKLLIFIGIVSAMELAFLMIWNTISYEIKENALHIDGALEKRDIPYSDIRALKLKDNFFTFDYSDGLGHKRIGICLRKGETYISPKNVDDFVSRLKEKIPDVEIIDLRKKK